MKLQGVIVDLARWDMFILFRLLPKHRLMCCCHGDVAPFTEVLLPSASSLSLDKSQMGQKLAQQQLRYWCD